MRKTRLFLFAVLVIALLSAGLMLQGGAASAQDDITLTLLHNSDGESALLSTTNTVAAGSPYGNTEEVDLLVGGVASFKTLMDAQISGAREGGNSVLSVYAGDAFLASSVLVCSLPPLNGPIYDAVAQRQMAYDAHIIGNHEFDFNPDFLERFIREFDDGSGLTQPFLSANLDFSAEPGFADLIDEDGLINEVVEDNRPLAHSMIYSDTVTGEQFGIVGATTPDLVTISSPRDVVVLDLAETIVAVQAEIDALEGLGINKIVFTSHLQDLENDIALLAELEGVDIAVGGGGDEVLVNSGLPTEQQLLPGEDSAVFGDYPYEAVDKNGDTVYLVTTKGNYKYLGRLDVNFDASGVITSVDLTESYPRRNIPDTPENTVAITALALTDISAPDPDLMISVIEPVEMCTQGFQETVLAYSEVVLDVSRDANRGREANGGNLITDAFLYAYETLADVSGVTAIDNPTVAVQNGGGIRQNAGDFLTGEITRQNTLDVLPFTNDVIVIENMTPELLKEVMEYSVSETLPWGGFMQVAGMRVVYDLAEPVGSRVVSITLMDEDDTAIVTDGEIVEDAPTINFVTNHFTAAGGDGYDMLIPLPTVALGDGSAKISYERALVLYLTESAEDFPVGDTGLPTIQAEDVRYQPEGEGRITFLEPIESYTLYIPAVYSDDVQW